MAMRTGCSFPSRCRLHVSKRSRKSLINPSLLSSYTFIFALHCTSRHKLLRPCHGGIHPCVSRSFVGDKPRSFDTSIGIVFRMRFDESNVSPSIQARERDMHAMERRGFDGVDRRLYKCAAAELHVHVPTKTTVLRSKDEVDVDARGWEAATKQ